LPSPITYFEDKSSTSGLLINGAIGARELIVVLESLIRERQADDATLLAQFQADTKTPEQREALLKSLRSLEADLRRLYNDYAYAFGAEARFGSNQPAVFASTVALSSNRLSLDLAYRHFAGARGRARDRQGNTLGFYHTDGDGFALRYEPTRRKLVRDIEEIRSLVSGILVRISDLKRLISDPDLVLSAGVRALRSDLTYIDDTQGQIIDTILPDTNEEYNHLSYKAIRKFPFATYASIDDIGTFGGIGLSISSFLLPFGDPDRDQNYRPTPGIFWQVAAQYAWYSPGAKFRQFNQHAQQDARFTLTFAYQDTVQILFNDLRSEQEVLRRWKHQYGFTFVSPNRVDGSGVAGLFVRSRNQYIEWNGGIDWDTSRGISTIHIGFLLGFPPARILSTAGH